jgi:mono/diheme cytochrome c family protein
MSSNVEAYDKWGLLTFLGTFSFCLLFFVYIAFVHDGIMLDEIREMPKDGQPVFNMAVVADPWKENADVVAHGAKIYKNNCASCHGEKGLGDAPAGMALVPPARNLVEGKWKLGGSSEALFKTLQNGISGGAMVSFKHLPKNDRWALVQFIRSITNNKVADKEQELASFAATAD